MQVFAHQTSNLEKRESEVILPREPIEEVQRENDELTLMLLETILSLNAKANVNTTEFQDMMGGVRKSHFQGRLKK